MDTTTTRVWGVCGGDAPRGLDPAHPRQPQVHQHQVGSKSRDLPERCLGVARGAHRLEVARRREGHRQAVAVHGVVVDDEHAVTVLSVAGLGLARGVHLPSMGWHGES